MAAVCRLGFVMRLLWTTYKAYSVVYRYAKLVGIANVVLKICEFQRLLEVPIHAPFGKVFGVKWGNGYVLQFYSSSNAATRGLKSYMNQKYKNRFRVLVSRCKQKTESQI